MIFTELGNVGELVDGDKLIVVVPSGLLVLCYWSRKGYLVPEVNYSLYYETSFPALSEIPYDESILVCRVTVERVGV